MDDDELASKVERALRSFRRGDRVRLLQDYSTWDRMTAIPAGSTGSVEWMARDITNKLMLYVRWSPSDSARGVPEDLLELVE